MTKELPGALREAQYDALALMQAVRRRVEKYQWDSGDANQEATSIANDIIGVVKRALSLSSPIEPSMASERTIAIRNAYERGKKDGLAAQASSEIREVLELLLQACRAAEPLVIGALAYVDCKRELGQIRNAIAEAEKLYAPTVTYPCGATATGVGVPKSCPVHGAECEARAKWRKQVEQNVTERKAKS